MWYAWGEKECMQDFGEKGRKKEITKNIGTLVGG
jgi:hypothetical protein